MFYLMLRILNEDYTNNFISKSEYEKCVIRLAYVHERYTQQVASTYRGTA